MVIYQRDSSSSAEGHVRIEMLKALFGMKVDWFYIIESIAQNLYFVFHPLSLFISNLFFIIVNFMFSHFCIKCYSSSLLSSISYFSHCVIFNSILLHPWIDKMQHLSSTICGACPAYNILLIDAIFSIKTTFLIEIDSITYSVIDVGPSDRLNW